MLKTYYLEGRPLHRWLVLSAVSLAAFTTTLNTTAVMNAALLAMSNELHLTSVSLQWIVNSYLLACASFIVVGGQLGDLFGRRNMFLISGSLFITVSFIIALSHGTYCHYHCPCITRIKRRYHYADDASYGKNILFRRAIGFAFTPVVSRIFTSYSTWRHIFWTKTFR